MLFLELWLSSAVRFRRGLNRTGSPRPAPSLILTPLPHEDAAFVAALPDTWDWRNVSGVDYTSADRDQHQPESYCGACWAFATAAHLNDRSNIARRNAFPRANVNVQAIITCGPSFEAGCTQGGDPSAALKWIYDQGGIPDETCHNYEAKDLKCHNRTGPTDHSISASMCQDCRGAWGAQPNTCTPINKFPKTTIREFGSLVPDGNTSDPKVIGDMVVRMKAEIVKRGPIVCQIACPDPSLPGHFGEHNGYLDDYQPFFNQWGENYPPRVLYNVDYTCPGDNVSAWDNCVDHNIVVSGFGSEVQRDGSTLPYWIVRNSWGTWWGEFGWFRIIQGINNLGIESRCDFGVI